MSAPARPPSFFNALSGADTPFPEALREPGYLLDDLAAEVRLWPCWLLDDDSPRRIALTLVEHIRERRAVIGFAVAGLSGTGTCTGTVTATPDPSGYLRIEVALDGAAVLTAYVERHWEEYDLWPPGAAAAPGTAPPGSMGKRRSWVSMSAAGWPALAAVANGNGWLNLLQLDERAEPDRAE